MMINIITNYRACVALDDARREVGSINRRRMVRGGRRYTRVINIKKMVHVKFII